MITTRATLKLVAGGTLLVKNYLYEYYWLLEEVNLNLQIALRFQTTAREQGCWNSKRHDMFLRTPMEIFHFKKNWCPYSTSIHLRHPLENQGFPCAFIWTYEDRYHVR